MISNALKVLVLFAMAGLVLLIGFGGMEKVLLGGQSRVASGERLLQRTVSDSLTWKDPTDLEIGAAVAYGVSGKNVAYSEFIRPWVVSLGKQSLVDVIVETPCYRIAYLERDAAREYRPRGEETARVDRYRNRLVLLVTLYGDSPRFTRFYHGVLTQNRRVFQSRCDTADQWASTTAFWPTLPNTGT